MKIKRLLDAYVRVEAITRPWLNREKRDRDTRETLERIAAGVRRHVDDATNVKVVLDLRDVCSYCGHEWEVDEKGAPVCCDLAVVDHEKGNA